MNPLHRAVLEAFESRVMLSTFYWDTSPAAGLQGGSGNWGDANWNTAADGGDAIFGATEDTVTFNPATHQTLFAELKENPGTNVPELRFSGAVNDIVVSKDLVTFHRFTSIVVAIGGLTEDPTHANDKTKFFKIPLDLYKKGYDVRMYAERNVKTDPITASDAYNAITYALDHTGATNYAIFGFSKGAGKSYLITEAMHAPNGPNKDAVFAAYIDGVQPHGSIIPGVWGGAEQHRPFATYFTNYYLSDHHGWTFFGKPLVNNDANNHEVDVSTELTGGGSVTHPQVDYFPAVQSGLLTDLQHPSKGRVSR